MTPSAPRPVHPPLSIIIPVHGSAGHLADALAPILDQISPADELVLVDNGVDGGVDLAAVGRHRARVIPARERPGPGFVRNKGAAMASHDLLLFVDDDDVAGEGYVEAMRTALGEHAVVGAAESFARLNPAQSHPETDHPAIWHYKDDPSWPFIGSDALGVRRDAFHEVGGFDEEIPALEDLDLCFRLVLAGHRLAPAPGAVMHVRHRVDDVAQHRRQISHGRASVWLERRYGHLGLPKESAARNALGWIKHLLAVLLTRDPERHRHLAVLGWKRGRLQGRKDAVTPHGA